MFSASFVSHSNHRPVAVPTRPWVMKHVWHDLLFLHWPVSVGVLRDRVPRQVEIDQFDGTAWLGIVAFWMDGIRLRYLPALPGASNFAELNVRTYVRHRGQSGVYFMSLDAPHRLLSWIARRWYRLAYVAARVTVKKDTGRIDFHSTRDDPINTEFRARYRAIGTPQESPAGSLEEWLTERYRLYAADPSGRLWKAEIAHTPWPLQLAEKEILQNTMPQSHGLPKMCGEPLAHYANRMETRVWSPELVGD